MRKEDRELLIKDLCYRLPYGVKCSVNYKDGTALIITLKTGLPNDFYSKEYSTYQKNIKPYLRPMSSMTDEEKEELKNIEEKYFGQALDKQIEEDLSSSSRDESRELEYFASSKIVDYLDKRMFDHRKIKKGNKRISMIKAGLALPAPEGMYKLHD